MIPLRTRLWTWLDRRLPWLRSRRPISLRSSLLIIVLIPLVPLLAFSFAIVSMLAQEQRDTFRAGAMARTQALLTAVDSALQGSISALQALGTSSQLEDGNLAAFQTEAERVLRRRPEWLTITVSRASGSQVVNLLFPFGTPLETRYDPVSFEEVLRTGDPVVGRVVRETATQSLGFPVRVPVEHDGGIAYVLTALVKPQAMQDLLALQDLPSDWVGVVLDRHSTIVARTIDAENLVGRAASQSLREALAGAPSGWFRGETIEGWPVFTPFNRSAASGWTVAMGIPAAALEGPYRRFLSYVGSFCLASLLLGVGLAWFLSARSARSIEDLARLATDVGRARISVAAMERGTAEIGPSEVATLRRALLDAARLLEQRSAERDRVESALRRAESTLRESDRRKDQFLAMLGHELRNPLGILSTAVHLLASRKNGDRALPELMPMMERQVRHMRQLLDDLLDVSRIARGRIEMKPVPCDLREVVRDAVHDFAEKFRGAGIAIHVDVPDAPTWVMGDRTRIAQAITNVLNNSLKFTDSGGRVDVELRRLDRDSAVLLRVRDTGVGMDPQILAHAFEPFSQADLTMDRSRGGLGLGLALVKGLIEMHGGEVGATSPGLGRGTEVSIRLPMIAAPAAPEAPAADPPAGDERPRRVLVVEDNPMAARSLQLFLELSGHRVEVAPTGGRAIEIAREFHPEVVLCDVGLPDMDGYQVAGRLRRDGGTRAHLVAVTGYGQEADRQRAAQAGFDRHLTKPVDLDELRRLLAAGPRDARGE